MDKPSSAILDAAVQAVIALRKIDLPAMRAETQQRREYLKALGWPEPLCQWDEELAEHIDKALGWFGGSMKIAQSEELDRDSNRR